MRQRLLVYLFWSSLAIFLGIAGLVAHDPLAVYSIDVWITTQAQNLPRVVMYPLMLAISGPGYFFASTIIALVIFLVWLWRQGQQQRAKMLAFSTAIGILTSVIIKRLIQRPRPADEFVQRFTSDRGFSFPSGHVLTYMACYGCLFLMLRGSRHISAKIVRALCAVLVLLVGPSRIYLGAHWPSDVLASYLLGVMILSGLWWIMREDELGVRVPANR